uniref:Uncharacterized protein n=1 Tax=Arundo donax TaxID=35708 RepID=A0A0A9BQH5_ARUDO
MCGEIGDARRRISVQSPNKGGSMALDPTGDGVRTQWRRGPRTRWGSGSG